MATTRGVPAEPLRRQSEERSTSARDPSQRRSSMAEGPEATSEQLRSQVIALQRISSLGVLAGGVFHELNNALTPILNYAKLGLRNPDPAYRERALKQIVESAQRAATITRGMLGLSRPGAGPADREPADLSQLVEEVVLLVNKDLAKHRVRLDVKVIRQPASAGRAGPDPAGAAQPLDQRPPGDAQGGVVRLRVGTDASRPARRAQRRRHRRRHRAGRPAAHLRAVLLDQDRARRRRAGRNGPGPGRLPRHRRSPPRPPLRREPPGPGLDVHHHPAGLPGDAVAGGVKSDGPLESGNWQLALPRFGDKSGWHSPRRVLE